MTRILIRKKLLNKIALTFFFIHLLQISSMSSPVSASYSSLFDVRRVDDTPPSRPLFSMTHPLSYTRDMWKCYPYTAYQSLYGSYYYGNSSACLSPEQLMLATPSQQTTGLDLSRSSSSSLSDDNLSPGKRSFSDLSIEGKKGLFQMFVVR